MEKKLNIGIISFYAYNYGAFLQAYALQNVLRNLGYDPEMIQYDYLHEKTILGIPLSDMRRPVKFAASIAKKILKYPNDRKKAALFTKSVEKNMKVSKMKYKNYRQLKKFSPVYDIYLTGSDQVWNPTINPQGFEARLLNFVSGSKCQKVSYAASIGLDHIPERYAHMFQNSLSQFSMISVREKEAVKSISKFTDQDVKKHIDPTLLLQKEKWLEFAETIDMQEPYILVYMLENQPELIMFANELSRKLNIKILSLGNGLRFNNCLRNRQVFNPEQFVGAVLNAEYVVTNSFHGTCFSIIMHKKARVFMPTKVSSRIRELMDNCNLQRLLENTMIEDGDLEEIYKGADTYLSNEREKALLYLIKLGDNIRL